MEKINEEEQKKLQRILSELRNHQATTEALRQNLSLLTASLSELSMTVEAIKTIKRLKPGTDILVPIGSDSFISAKLGTTEKVITGLGADVAAERSIIDAIVTLQDRMAELEQALNKTREELEKLDERIEALTPEAERLLEKSRKEQP
ncbi:Prefoldin subunit alpha [subsurface metagenome]|nr:prefoldin subunit alpha [Hadesarchaea archaeon]TES83540.1 MAG: prefoldin subunit alpha [Hadesarchaea archaeon]